MSILAMDLFLVTTAMIKKDSAQFAQQKILESGKTLIAPTSRMPHEPETHSEVLKEDEGWKWESKAWCEECTAASQFDLKQSD
ncbi:unnamed protein product [Notodromas monacha]|uniref:Uncharacterized protein n=1 Tax=Notodromas monacha TaxID=399045 RepID=A0A7R9BL44_9CRUS|nr:unnamed protein product [Notodromas monacha]CAG0917486.1 unnamed protein product [Notodromas monacha]